MGLSLVTPPTTEPVLLDDLKEHCSVAADDLDEVLRAKLAEARTWVERETARQLMTATWDYVLDSFPRQPLWGQSADVTIRLPLAPVQSVTHIKYLDTAGIEQTLSASNYKVVITGEPARIVPTYGYTWPSTRPEIAAVTVRFIAGWTRADLIPQTLLAAVKLYAGHLLENREATTTGSITGAVAEVPLGVERLLALHRWGLYP